MTPCAARHAEGAGPSTLSNPRRFLPLSLREALLAVEATHGRLLRTRGYAAVGPQGELVACQTVEDARRAAVLLAANGPAAVARAVAATRLGGLLWHHVEKVEWREAPGRAWDPIAHDGTVRKAVTPQFQRYGELLGGTLRMEDRRWATPVIKKYMDRLDRRWKSMTPEQVDLALKEAEAAIRGANLQSMRRAWTKSIGVTVVDVADTTRAIIRERYLPRIQATMTGADLDAVRSIGRQGGWFLRDQMGRRSAALTTRGQGIISRGLKLGLGSDEITSNLQAGVPGLWNKWGTNYARASANVAVNRARAFSEVSGYQQAGVVYLEVQAVLDEATTQICRAMDGQIITVESAASIVRGAQSVRRPEDIYTASPFMRMGRDPRSGVRQLRTTTGGLVATQQRAGVGWDDRGKWSFHASGDKLTGMKIGPPPYHHNCRSWTVPRSDLVQVPRGYDAVAQAGPPEVPTTRRVDRAVLAPRPISTLPIPTPRAPQLRGIHQDLDDLDIPENAIAAEAPAHLSRAVRERGFGLTYQDWEAQGDRFVAPGRWRILPKSIDTVEAAWRAQALPERRVIAAQVRGGLALQDIAAMLNHDAATAGRLWSVVETGTGRTVMLRTSGMLGTSAEQATARRWMNQALAAADETALREALVQMERLELIASSEANYIKQLTGTRPAGTTAVTRPAKGLVRVLPTRADPYRAKPNQLLPKIPLDEQVRRRVSDQATALYRYLNYELRVDGLTGVAMPSEWYGRKIQKYIATRVSSTEAVRIPARSMPKMFSPKDKLRTLGSYSLTYGRSLLKDMRLLERHEVERIYTEVLRIYGPEMRRAVLAKPLPPIACGTVNLTQDIAAAAEYSIHGRTILLAEPYTGRPDQLSALAHELAHHVDEVLPTVGEAGVLERNRLTTGGKLRYRKKQDVWVMNGPWLEDYQGAVLGTDYGTTRLRTDRFFERGHGENAGGYKNTSEFNSQLREYIDDPQRIGWQYAKSQEAVSYTISVLRGQFVPGAR